MKKKLFIFITTLFFFICTVSSCSFFNKELDPNTFNNYTKELLTPLIGNDEFTQHFLFKDPTSYGLSETGDISLPTPTVSNTLSKVLINLIFSDLNNYNYDKLNFDQQMTYNILTNLVDSINDKTLFSYKMNKHGRIIKSNSEVVDILWAGEEKPIRYNNRLMFKSLNPKIMLGYSLTVLKRLKKR